MKSARKFFVLPRAGELLGLFMLFGAILLAMAFISYSPGDVSFFTRDTSQPHASNLAGRVGATVAALCFGLFGLASYFILVPMAVGGWRRIWSRDGLSLGAGIFGYGGIFTGLLSILTLVVGSIHVGGEEVLAGGVAGAYVADFLQQNLNTAGAFITSVAFMALGATIASHISFTKMMAAGRVAAVGAVRHGRTAFVRWRETRRKRKLREQIIRKHAQRDDESAKAEAQKAAQKVAAVAPAATAMSAATAKQARPPQTSADGPAMVRPR